MKDHLTDRALKKLAKDAQEAKKPIDMMDDDVKAFGARAQSTGTVSFILYRRFPGSPSPVRRTLGYWGGPVTKDEAERREKRRQETGEGIQAGSVMSLPEARELARDWISAIKKGRDPSRMAEQEAQANIERERVRRVNTVESVLQSYFRVKGELRTIHKMEVTLRRELASWLDRSIQDISVDDVEDRINAIKPRGKSSSPLRLRLDQGFLLLGGQAAQIWACRIALRADRRLHPGRAHQQSHPCAGRRRASFLLEGKLGVRLPLRPLLPLRGAYRASAR